MVDLFSIRYTPSQRSVQTLGLRFRVYLGFRVQGLGSRI